MDQSCDWGLLISVVISDILTDTGTGAERIREDLGIGVILLVMYWYVGIGQMNDSGIAA